MAISLYINDKGIKRLNTGHPWLFKGHFDWTSEGELAPIGSLCHIYDKKGGLLAGGYVNPKTDLCVRLLWSGKKAPAIDAAFFDKRITRALNKRKQDGLFPYARIINSEGDFLPGLIADMYDDILTIAVQTAGMEKLRDFWLPILKEKTGAKEIVFKHDDKARRQEGLNTFTEETDGTLDETLYEIKEGDVTYLSPLKQAQKTGWYYDQRANRQQAARLAKGKSVLDIHTHAGGFALACAVSGATNILGVDRSALAIDTAKKAAALNKVDKQCEFIVDDAEEFLQNHDGRTFDIVILDPPPYIKAAHQKVAGLMAYERLVASALPWIKPNGHLVFAACSYHADTKSLIHLCENAFKKQGRDATLTEITGADSDHPIHPQMPEGRYLHCLWFELMV